jgi:F420-non-reducing hydrogenase large subunit
VAERNILGVIHKVGLEIGGKVINARKAGHTVIEMIGGRKVHPCTSIPGGLTKGITREQRDEILKLGQWAVEFAQFSLKLFNDIVLGNKAYVDLILGDIYTHRTYYMGMVDENNHINFYDGKVRVVGPEGQRICQVCPAGLHQAHCRACGALDLPEVPLSQRCGLERLSWTARIRASTAPPRSRA